MKKILRFLFISIFTATLFSCVQTVDEYPCEYDDYTWIPISSALAEAKWITPAKKEYSKATVYNLYTGNLVRRFKDCPVSDYKPDPDHFQVSQIDLITQVTYGKDFLTEDKEYFTTLADTSLLRIKSGDNSSQTVYTFKDGWLREHCIITNQDNNHQMCCTYFDYIK